MESQVLKAIIYFIPFLLSLCVHEWAHAKAAKLLGDNTAEFMGRLTLNPLKHADLLGTFVFPLLALVYHTPFFGWAKPVPVNPRNFKHPTRDMAIVAFAGPLSNLIIAISVALLWRPLIYLAGSYHAVFTPLVQACVPAIWINLFLAVFNMIPIAPLDGSRIIRLFLSPEWLRAYDNFSPYAPFLLIALFLTGGLRYLVIPVGWLYQALNQFLM